MAGVISFMESPLIAWVRTFADPSDPTDFQEICDGVFLNDVMVQLDHRDLDLDSEIKRSSKDSNGRIQNWGVLLKNIHSYYQDVLQQIVVMEMPDIVSMVKEPTKESSLSAMKQVMLLLLGCAVQCDHKEDHINVIKTLDIQLQQALVNSIQEITDNCENVVDMDGIIGEKQLIRTVRNVVDERNDLAQRLLTATQERDFYKQEVSDRRVGGGGPLTPPVHMERYQLYRELTDLKQKTHSLRQELEEKSKTIADLQEDVSEAKDELLKVKSENVTLSRDAKAVHCYRDELDALREKALSLEHLEKDVARYKEHLREQDFYKSRVEELRRDNDLLVEARRQADDQLTTANTRLEATSDSLLQIQLRLDALNKEKDELSAKLQEVCHENSLLEFEKSQFRDGYGSSTHGSIRRILSTASIDIGGSQQHIAGNSISDELQDSMMSQMSRLETERDQLRQELDDARQRLAEAQQVLAKVTSDTEQEIQRKVGELARRHRQREMSEEYRSRSDQLQAEYDQKLSRLDQAKADVEERCTALGKQARESERLLTRTKDQCSRLEKANKVLEEETKDCRRRIQSVRENMGQRISQLEHEVEAARMKSGDQDRSMRVCDLCDGDMSKDNNSVSYLREKMLSDSFQGPDRANKSCQTSPSPARISYCSDEMQGQENEHQTGRKSTSKSKFLDILRPKPSSNVREGSPLPNRPATVLGVVHENRTTSTPIKGVVTPQRRSVPSTPEKLFREPFRRNDKLRSTIHHTGGSRGIQHRGSGCAQSPGYSSSFSRSDRLRRTMPEKRSGYEPPPPRQVPLDSSRSSISSMDSTDLDNTILAYMDRAQCPGNLSRELMYSDKDSGCPTSPDTPRTPDSAGHHTLTSFEVFSSETVKTQVRTATLPKDADKWRGMVERIVKLQNRNQQLLADNAGLRKSVNSAKFSADRTELLEKRTLDLEVENRKLHKIVDSLQSTLAGLNPYDKRKYHFYSNV